VTDETKSPAETPGAAAKTIERCRCGAALGAHGECRSCGRTAPETASAGNEPRAKRPVGFVTMDRPRR